MAEQAGICSIICHIFHPITQQSSPSFLLKHSSPIQSTALTSVVGGGWASEFPVVEVSARITLAVRTVTCESSS